MEYKLTDDYEKLILVFEKIRNWFIEVRNFIGNLIRKIIENSEWLLNKIRESGDNNLKKHASNCKNTSRQKFIIMKNERKPKCIDLLNKKNLPYQRRNY